MTADEQLAVTLMVLAVFLELACIYIKWRYRL